MGPHSPSLIASLSVPEASHCPPFTAPPPSLLPWGLSLLPPSLPLFPSWAPSLLPVLPPLEPRQQLLLLLAGRAWKRNTDLSPMSSCTPRTQTGGQYSTVQRAPGRSWGARSGPQYCTVVPCTVQYCTVQSSAAQRSAVQYSIVLVEGYGKGDPTFPCFVSPPRCPAHLEWLRELAQGEDEGQEHPRAQEGPLHVRTQGPRLHTTGGHSYRLVLYNTVAGSTRESSRQVTGPVADAGEESVRGKGGQGLTRWPRSSEGMMKKRTAASSLP